MSYFSRLRTMPLPSCSATATRAVAAGRAPSLRYRPDIDGLRAIAVISVVLFHLDVGLIKGGFIGVDIFFVISGYLITNILRVDIKSGHILIGPFYDRRVRRIFPALFAMMLATTIFALAFLLPPELVDFAHSGITTAFFFSNMYFMLVTDYFNTAGDTNPLLHTWSLAVEEQFYLFFPLLLYGLRHASRPVLLLVLGALGILSFALSVELVRANQTAAFYLSPSRAWEFLMGSIFALEAFPPLRRAWLREAVASLGFGLILAGSFVFYANMAFPGVWALVPCFGAACVIYAGEEQPTWVSRLLSLKSVVFVGLISYSLYLWHWPIIVFARLWWLAPIGIAGKMLLFLASMAAGTTSWWFVERPYRLRRLLTTARKLRLAGLASMSGAALVAGALMESDGIAAAFPSHVRQLASFIHYDDRLVYRRGTCFLDSHTDTLADYDAAACGVRTAGRPVLLLIGDSHAAHLWSGLKAAFPAVEVLQATASGCKPVLHGRGAAPCVALVDRTIALATSSPSVEAVVLSARWTATDLASLIETVDLLSRHVGRIYVAGPIVEYREALPRLLALAALRGTKTPLTRGRLTEQANLDESMRAALVGHGATYLSAYQALCPLQTEPCVTESADGTPVQWDYGHLTAQGSALVVDLWRAGGRLESP